MSTGNVERAPEPALRRGFGRWWSHSLERRVLVIVGPTVLLGGVLVGRIVTAQPSDRDMYLKLLTALGALGTALTALLINLNKQQQTEAAHRLDTRRARGEEFARSLGLFSDALSGVFDDGRCDVAWQRVIAVTRRARIVDTDADDLAVRAIEVAWNTAGSLTTSRGVKRAAANSLNALIAIADDFGRGQDGAAAGRRVALDGRGLQFDYLDLAGGTIPECVTIDLGGAKVGTLDLSGTTINGEVRSDGGLRVHEMSLDGALIGRNTTFSDVDLTSVLHAERVSGRADVKDGRRPQLTINLSPPLDLEDDADGSRTVLLGGEHSNVAVHLSGDVAQLRVVATDAKWNSSSLTIDQLRATVDGILDLTNSTWSSSELQVICSPDWNFDPYRANGVMLQKKSVARVGGARPSGSGLLPNWVIRDASEVHLDDWLISTREIDETGVPFDSLPITLLETESQVEIHNPRFEGVHQRARLRLDIQGTAHLAVTGMVSHAEGRVANLEVAITKSSRPDKSAIKIAVVDAQLSGNETPIRASFWYEPDGDVHEVDPVWQSNFWSGEIRIEPVDAERSDWEAEPA